MRLESVSPRSNTGRFLKRFPGVWLAGAVMTAMLAGCDDFSGGTTATVPLRDIQGVAQFQKEVLQASADRPVIVEFYKVPCPTCDVEQARLEKLAAEYGPRVKFLRFQTANMTWENLCPEIKERYKLYFVPTVLLFYGGQERHRWEFNALTTDSYRDGIDAVLQEVNRKKMAAQPAAGRTAMK